MRSRHELTSGIAFSLLLHLVAGAALWPRAAGRLEAPSPGDALVIDLLEPAVGAPRPAAVTASVRPARVPRGDDESAGRTVPAPSPSPPSFPAGLDHLWPRPSIGSAPVPLPAAAPGTALPAGGGDEPATMPGPAMAVPPPPAAPRPALPGVAPSLLLAAPPAAGLSIRAATPLPAEHESGASPGAVSQPPPALDLVPRVLIAAGAPPAGLKAPEGRVPAEGGAGPGHGGAAGSRGGAGADVAAVRLPAGSAPALIGGTGAGSAGEPASARESAPGGSVGERDTKALAVLSPGMGTVAAEYEGYVRSLRRRIQERLEYPWLAARQGISGSVELELRIAPDGRLTAAEVIGGAAAASLRGAALRAVRDATPLPFPAGLAARPLIVRLPVVFELR